MPASLGSHQSLASLGSGSLTLESLESLGSLGTLGSLALGSFGVIWGHLGHLGHLGHVGRVGHLDQSTCCGPWTMRFCPSSPHFLIVSVFGQFVVEAHNLREDYPKTTDPSDEPSGSVQ